MQSNQQDNQEFDKLNQTSYLLRLNLNKLNFDVHKITVANNTIWHVLYNDIVVGTVTYNTTEDNFTYCNVRIFQYIKKKFDKEIEDFKMSKYFEFDKEGKHTKFLFEEFNEYFGEIAHVLLNTDSNEVTSHDITVVDSLSRLREYCDEFDEKFSKNILAKDIRVLLQEYDTLKTCIDAVKVE